MLDNLKKCFVAAQMIYMDTDGETPGEDDVKAFNSNAEKVNISPQWNTLADPKHLHNIRAYMSPRDITCKELDTEDGLNLLLSLLQRLIYLGREKNKNEPIKESSKKLQAWLIDNLKTIFTQVRVASEDAFNNLKAIFNQEGKLRPILLGKEIWKALKLD